MKKTKIFSSFLLAVLLSLATIVGFANKMTVTDANAYNEDDYYSVGISVPSLEYYQANYLVNAMVSVFSSYNFIPIIWDAQNDVLAQIHQIDDLAAQGVDAIVVMPIDENALYYSLDNASQLGIIIIIIGPDRGICPFAYYFELSFTRAQEEVEDFIYNHWDQNEETTVVVIACNNGYGREYAYEIRMGFKPYSIKVKVIYVDDPVDAYWRIQEWINANRLPDGIFNCCSANVQAVVDALYDLGYEFDPDGIPIYGIGSDEGDINYDKIAEAIADLLKELLKGELPPTRD